MPARHTPRSRAAAICRFLCRLAMLVLACAVLAPDRTARAQPPQRILFVGNSFTYGAHAPVWHYRSGTVADLNGDGVGGVPALFKQFATEAGLDYAVSLETDPGQTLRFHYTQRRAKLDRAWDHVIMQEYSTLDPAHPGNPAQLRRYAHRLAAMFHRRNPGVDVRLLATWSRPDLTYQQGGHWYGQPITAMARDVDEAEHKVAASDPLIHGVIPLGLAFNRAIREGIADADPYDGIGPGKIDLWAWDRYHASVYGYYLEALMDFGAVTGRDPRRLGRDEKAAAELGISPGQAAALQRVAYRQLHTAPG